MITVTVSDAALRQAAEEGMDEFVKVFIDGIQKAIGGQLTNENMARLNADQITLLGWSYLHEEVSDGGYVQLIYNGLGAFNFHRSVKPPHLCPHTDPEALPSLLFPWLW